MEKKIIADLRRIIKTITLSSLRIKRETGVGLSPLFCLQCLAQTGPISFRQLGQRVGLSPSAITHIVDQLEQKGLVERVRSNKDRRVILAELTKSGAKMAIQLPQTPQAKLENGLKKLSGSQVKQIERSLSIICEIIGADQLVVDEILELDSSIGG